VYFTNHVHIHNHALNYLLNWD